MIGQKTGIGFYKYEGRNAVGVNPDLDKLLKQIRQSFGNPKEMKVSDQEIIELLFYPCVNEAYRVVQEKIVYRSSDVDVCSVYGMSFPADYGGLLKWCELQGVKHVYNRLQYWYNKTGQKVFRPCRLLTKLAQTSDK